MSETKFKNKTETTVTVEEVEAAEKQLRDKAKTLYKNIETTYWELGGVLYAVFDGLPGGYRDLMKGDGSREVRRELFRKWGYSSFEEYCENEIGIMRRTASNLRYIYWYFEIQLKIPAELKEQVKRLGRSKMYTLAGFVTDDNLISWLEKAANMTNDQLKKAVAGAKALNKAPDVNGAFEHAQNILNNEAQQNKEHMDAPAPETMHTLNTNLYEGQWDTWQSALDRAKNITKSDKISHNLEMICQDYLATNNFVDPADDQRRYFAKIEQLTHMRIVAIEPNTGKAVYGADLLWAMIQQRMQFEKEDKLLVESTDSTDNADNNEPSIKLVKNDSEPPATF
jgi:hypothetical protein